MLFVVFFVVEFFLVSAQTTLLPFLPESLGRPDLIFILVAFISYRFDWLGGACLVFSLGWMLDVVSSLFMGIYPIQYLAVFIILKVMSTVHARFKEEAYQVPLAAALYLLSQMTLSFFFSQLGLGSQPFHSWAVLAQDAIVLLIATVPFFLFYNVLFERFSRQRIPSHRLRRVKKEKRGF